MDQEDLVGIDIPGAPGEDNEEDGSGMHPCRSSGQRLKPWCYQAPGNPCWGGA